MARGARTVSRLSSAAADNRRHPRLTGQALASGGPIHQASRTRPAMIAYLLAITLCCPLTAAETPMPWPHPRLVAHRGGALLAPENTLPAFAEAARRGYRAIECDVALTADGVPVLLHDATLKRTAGLDARLANTPLATVTALEAGAWFAPRFTGTRIPTLEQAIAAWQRDGQQALIELKVHKGEDPERLGRTAAGVVLRCWRGEPPMFISFDAKALAAAAATAPAVPRALLLESPWPDDWKARVATARATALDIEHTLVTAARVAAIHAAGLHLIAWTVNEPARAHELLALGVDAITTDAIDRIAP